LEAVENVGADGVTDGNGRVLEIAGEVALEF